MDDHKELTPNQRRVIPYLLAAPWIEEGCKHARISKATVYQWLKDETFRQELKRQRDANLVKATETLVKHLNSTRETISIRAAERIIEFTQKSLEHEELERRIEALEAQLDLQSRSR